MRKQSRHSPIRKRLVFERETLRVLSSQLARIAGGREGDNTACTGNETGCGEPPSLRPETCEMTP